MTKEIAKPQLSLVLISKGIAYIDADVQYTNEKGELLTGAQAVASICDNEEWIHVSATRSIRTHQVVEVMSPAEVKDQRKYQRGWYQKGGWWYNAKNEKCDKVLTQEDREKLSIKNRLGELSIIIKDRKLTGEEGREYRSLSERLKKLN